MSTRYAFVGLGHRVRMYVDALLGDWRDTGTIVGLCDTNRTRMDYYAERIGGDVPRFHPDEFGKLLELADAVVVTTVDVTHARYVVAALDAGLDVIVEKPLTIDAEGCEAIAAAAERNPGKLVVTFNYRYSPRNSAVKKLISEGEIGESPRSTSSGRSTPSTAPTTSAAGTASKANSGGLLVHKSTHHFDLVNWWLATAPELVFAQTDLRFYGQALPRGPRPVRGQGAPGLGTDPFILDISADEQLKRLYLDAEHEDGYIRDQDVFGPGVTIDDNMSVLVRYANRATLTYSLNAHAPYEGYRVVFNGTEGRIELEVCERSWTPPHAAIDPSAATKQHAAGAWERLTLHRHWQEREEIADRAGGGRPRRRRPAAAERRLPRRRARIRWAALPGTATASAACLWEPRPPARPPPAAPSA